MSIESAKAFIEKMKSDEEFAKKIMAETNEEARMALACGEGFAFTKDEIGQLAREIPDDELDGVAGGNDGKIIVPMKMGVQIFLTRKL